MHDAQMSASITLAEQAQADGTAPADLRRVVVPAWVDELAPVSPERLVAYRQHVEQVVDESYEDGPVAQDSKPHPPELLRACAVCRGHCCRHGVEKAYLNAGTLRRFRIRHPELDRAGLVAAYMDAVPEQTHPRSCINHGPSGCGLASREMRSPTCNAYLCGGILPIVAVPVAPQDALLVCAVAGINVFRHQVFLPDPQADPQADQ